MKEITVTYTLNDDEYERLERITNKYKEKGLDITLEKMFINIMTTGSKNDIDQKLNLHEYQLGLKDSYN